MVSAAAAVSLAGLLAGCNASGPFGGGGSGGAGEPVLSAPTSPVQSKPLAGAAATPSAIGSGPDRIALVLPLTQNGAPSAVGTSLRRAAELAYADFGFNDLTILVKDDRSTPEGARDATQAAIGEGAELVLGPLFAADVREAARVAKAADKPVIGFSTDASAASRGVYLLSFMIESYVDRIVDYAVGQGKKSFAVMAPETDYGNVALAAFQEAAARRGARVQAVERYAPGGAGEAAGRVAAALGGVDALFIPDQADAMPGVAQALTAAGIDGHKVQILGTGVWSDARVLKLPALQGAWIATPETSGFTAFSGRYRAKFGAEPARVATLSYDAVSLAAALAHTQGSQRFAEATLTNASGFTGADGVFRFKPEGPNERGLAVLQVKDGAAVTISPAPRTFSNT